MPQSLESGDPRRVGRFTLDGRLRRGELWQVYAGSAGEEQESSDPHGSQRVSVKLVHPHFARDEAFLLEFARIAARAQGIRCGTFTAIVEHGVSDGRAWVATMGEVGDPLTGLGGIGGLRAAQLVQLAAELARHLAGLHAAGLVHGDLSPACVYRLDEGHFDLHDFGFGSLLGAEPSDDVYRLGAIVVLAAIGELPSAGVSFAEYLAAHPPDVGRAARAATIAPPLTAGFWDLIGRCLSPDPATRPSAAELAADLILASGAREVLTVLPPMPTAAEPDVEEEPEEVRREPEVPLLSGARAEETGGARRPTPTSQQVDGPDSPLTKHHAAAPDEDPEDLLLVMNQLNQPNASIGPPVAPGLARMGPLPHSGLFRRRHSAFGTRLATGIRDLVEQGVLVEQERIRFDDFVAGRTGDVPAPEAGEAVAVSHGLAPVAPGLASSPQATHFLEIALRAGDGPAADAGAAKPGPPLNVVFVVDTSDSMGWEGKLETAKAVMLALYAQLRPDDVFGIVSFSHEVRTVLPARRAGDQDDGEVMRTVRSMQASGGTDLNRGILFGLIEAGRATAARPDAASCVYLFSDGLPEHGETSWLKIRANAAAEARGNVTLSCFGFGAQAKMEELEALAGLTGGHCTLVTRPEEVTLNLAADLVRRDHLAAVNVQLKISIPEKIGIWHFYGHDLITDPVARAAVLRDAREARELGVMVYGAESQPDIITDEDGIRVFAPDLAAGETYWIVLEIARPKGWKNARRPSGTAIVQYVDTVARQARRREIGLNAAGSLTASTVTSHALGLRTSEVAFDALADLRIGSQAVARQRLERHAELLRTASRDLATPTLADDLADDQVTLRKLAALIGAGQPRSGTGAASRDRDHDDAQRLAEWALRDLGGARGGYDRRIGLMTAAAFVHAPNAVFNLMNGTAENVIQGRDFRGNITM